MVQFIVNNIMKGQATSHQINNSILCPGNGKNSEKANWIFEPFKKMIQECIGIHFLFIHVHIDFDDIL